VIEHVAPWRMSLQLVHSPVGASYVQGPVEVVVVTVVSVLVVVVTDVSVLVVVATHSLVGVLVVMALNFSHVHVTGSPK